MRESPFFHYNSSFDATGVMKRYAVDGLKPDKDHLTNFLGVRIAPHFFPGILDGHEGRIEPIPIPANWHADIAEWAFALRTVDLAQETYKIVELGCGWGCWLNNTGVAARRRGLGIELIGVESDLGHVQFAHQALETNGFTPDQYRIIHGAAGTRSGTALFPSFKSGYDWGSQPLFDTSEDDQAAAIALGTHELASIYRLSDIYSEGIADLLHIDIQGSEAEFIESNIDHIEANVRRMLVGTHSRVIEGNIMSFLLDRGWSLEIERPCIFGLESTQPVILVDGVQGWFSPYL